MDVMRDVTRALDEVLSLNGRSASFTRDTYLLGAVNTIEDLHHRFGVTADADEHRVWDDPFDNSG